MLDISKVYFSPSKTTKKVIDTIASNFNVKNEYDLLNFSSDINFSKNDLVIFAIPIFAGRLPKTASERLMKIKGNNTKAIGVVNYGNAQIGDAFLELEEILTKNNFNLIAAASTVSHHSIFSNVAVGRPDEKDLEKISEFSKNIVYKLESGDESIIKIPNEKQGIELKQLPFEISCDETLCAFCYDCVSICPEKAIPDDDPIATDLDICSRCTACISICPEDARSFSGDAFNTKKQEFEKANNERKEAEFYL